MNLLLGCDSLRERRSGIGRMTIEIAQALRLRDDVQAMRLVIGGQVAGPDWLDRSADDAPRRDAPLLRSLAARAPALHALRRFLVRGVMNRAGRGLAAGGRPVVYYEPNMIAKPYDGVTVVNVNDLSWHPPHRYHPADRVRWIERNLPATLRQASRFVAISAFTRNEMVRVLGLPSDRIDVVPLAPSGAFRPCSAVDAAPVLGRLGLRDRGFVLAVSTLEPRKNFDGLLAGWCGLPPAVRAQTPLVIAGGAGWGEVLASTEAERLRGSGHLRLLGHVPDAALSILCARCAVFAHVSLYEGFGLTVLEAMQAGAPVVASSTTATAETAGDAALLVDPLDPEAIAAALRRVLEDDGLAASLRDAGQAHAATFTWTHTADLLMQSFQRALV